jgi:myo-inositol-1(or 4)-monophosphatase
VIAAAVLHDVIEDAKVQVCRLVEVFGSRIAGLVSAESEEKLESRPPGETWVARKSEALRKLVGESLDAKMIALGDKLSNMRATNRDYETLGDGIWARFNQKDPRQHAWYYTSISRALSELSPYQAYKEFSSLVEKVFGHDGVRGQ